MTICIELFKLIFNNLDERTVCGLLDGYGFFHNLCCILNWYDLAIKFAANGSYIFLRLGFLSSKKGISKSPPQSNLFKIT